MYKLLAGATKDYTVQRVADNCLISSFKSTHTAAGMIHISDILT